MPAAPSALLPLLQQVLLGRDIACTVEGDDLRRISWKASARSHDLVVKETDPGFAGDTATGARKPATLETGLVVQVPLFIKEGEIIKVSTEDGSYLGRA